MTAQQIQLLADTAALPGGGPVQLLETHISWVLLTPHFAFKIKKPVAFPFLDFHTLEKRRFYCTEELRLNRRLAPALYLDVCPIIAENGHFAIREPGTGHRQPVDYAVRMHRLDNARRMDVLLEQHRVRPADVEVLARLLVPFHRQHRLPADSPYDPTEVWTDFADLFSLENDVQRWLGEEAVHQLRELKTATEAFFNRHRARLAGRHAAGFRVDGHGDLHARNIFLVETGPVVFDCLEFNEHLRRLDVLSELGFLAMDLDSFGQPALAKVFLKTYRSAWDIMPEPEDVLLLDFFKAYRANVRLKVMLLGLRQHADETVTASARCYWELLAAYGRALGQD